MAETVQRIPHARSRAFLALCLLVPAPSLGIACEMLWFEGPVGLSILGLTKVWILALPFLWTRFVDGERGTPFSRPRVEPSGAGASSAGAFTGAASTGAASTSGPAPARDRGLLLGLITGLVGAAAVVLAYQFVLGERIDPTTVREMARANGLLSPPSYLAVAVYICLLNSLLEEYVWRWFVYRRFETLVGRPAAVVLAALAFTLHHSLLLGTQFGAELCWIGSTAVFVAGVAWSWQFARTRGLWSPWLSHALIDVAVFWAGWQILFVA